ncbi:MAG: hypothetical protein WD317_07490, partial [Balneolaceae bacterium]
EMYYEDNKSRTVRAALESLATHAGHNGWVISGYTALKADESTECRTCGKEHQKGSLLYKPVFERGSSPEAMKTIPRENWVECSVCVQSR